MQFMYCLLIFLLLHARAHAGYFLKNVLLWLGKKGRGKHQVIVGFAKVGGRQI